MATKNEKKSIAALVCGILGLVGGWFPLIQYFTLVLAIVAIVLGVKARKGKGKNGMATAGLVLGIIGVAGTVASILCVICAGAGLAAISL